MRTKKRAVQVSRHLHSPDHTVSEDHGRLTVFYHNTDDLLGLAVRPFFFHLL